MINIITVLRTPKKSLNPNKPHKQYSLTDVLKIKKMFETYLTQDHNFFCLTDQQTDKELTIIPLIDNTPNWWAKIEMFRPNLFTGPCFYIDLDMIICSSIDELINNILDEKFLMLKDPKGNGATSSIMFWNGDYSVLWEEYCKNKEVIWETYKSKPRIGDQFFIQERINFKFFNDINEINPKWFHFIKPNNDIGTTSKILIFEGKSNKPWSRDYSTNEYVNKYWRNLDV